MNDAWLGIGLVLLCSVLEGFAQVCLKKSSAARLQKYFWISLGLTFFAMEAIFYTAALQMLAVSTAYPVGALSFVSVALFSRWLLKETLDTRRWIGLGFILTGCALVAAP
ncbi:MAG: SMR family transporter [Magnetococcus sp. XQGC-1]